MTSLLIASISTIIFAMILAFILETGCKKKKKYADFFEPSGNTRVDMIRHILLIIGKPAPIDTILYEMYQQSFFDFGNDRIKAHRNLSKFLLYYSRRNKYWEQIPTKNYGKVGEPDQVEYRLLS